MKPTNHLKIIQAERKLSLIRSCMADTRLRQGWIKYMRSVFGLSLKKLAALSESSIPTVAQSEKNEVRGKITVETLKRLAEAMECEFIYAFVPKKEIPSLLEEKAYLKAKKYLLKTDSHMALEDQKVEGDLEKRVKRLADELLSQGDVW